MVVSRDITSIITQDAAPKNACGRGTGNKYIISHGLSSRSEVSSRMRLAVEPVEGQLNAMCYRKSELNAIP